MSVIKKKESVNGVAQKVIVAKKDSNLKMKIMSTAIVVPLVVIHGMNVSQNTKQNLIIHIVTAKV